jgi:hypothetical protein
MRLTLSQVLVLGLFTLTLASPAWALQVPPTSVRAAALARVLLGSDAEPAAVFTNPAGLADVPHPELFTSFSKPYVGLPGITLWTGDLALAWPFAFGGLGLGYSSFQTDGLLGEQALSLGFGFVPWGRLRVGLAVKYLRHDYLIGADPLAAADPVFQNGTSRGVVTGDLGLRYPVGDTFVLSAAVRQINQPDWGLASLDRVRLETQAGVGLTIPDWDLSLFGDIRGSLTPEGEAADPVTPAFGVEKRFGPEGFALRAGVDTYEVTAGFGWTWDPWTLEYAGALKFNLLADNYGTHRLGLSLRLGSDPAPVAAATAPAAVPPPVHAAPVTAAPAAASVAAPPAPKTSVSAQPTATTSKTKSKTKTKKKKTKPAPVTN